MVWHIFKKDWKLLWIFVVMVALLNFVAEWAVHELGLFGESSMLELLAEQLPIATTFAMMFLIVAIVHLDPVPGLRQDWLVRPVRRRDLLLEKLLFVVLAVEGPVFLANLSEGLASHFSLRESLAAAAWRVAFLLFFLVLPIFILASVTQNMTEAFIFGCGCSFIIGVFLTFSNYANDVAHGTLNPVVRSGVGWIGEVFRFGIVVASAAVILSLQFFRRKTLVSRILVLAFGLLILFSVFVPWGPTFAVEQKLSPNPNAASATSLTFDLSAERYRSPSGVDAETNRRVRQDHLEVFLPLRIGGVHADEMLVTDRAEVHLINSSGRVIYHGDGEGMKIDRTALARGPSYQEIELPEALYHANQDQPLRAEINYSLTIFGFNESYAIPALNGDERTSEWGWCQTRMNEGGTAIELRCMKPGTGPICDAAFLENVVTGVRDPEQTSCESNYTPFGDRAIPDNFDHFGGNFRFRDPSGLAKYPVDGPQLANSRVVIRNYKVEAHFTRSLVIPELRLKDWEAQ